MTHIDGSNRAMTNTFDLQTSAAMLISVFGQPERAGAQVSSYEWRLAHPDGSQARIFSQQTLEFSASAVQTWRVEGDCAAAIDQVQQALQAGENYYEGTLHPELFISRKR
jgi:hypothetical protein